MRGTNQEFGWRVGSRQLLRADAVLGTWWLRCNMLSGDVLLISLDAEGVRAGVCVHGCM